MVFGLLQRSAWQQKLYLLQTPPSRAPKANKNFKSASWLQQTKDHDITYHFISTSLQMFHFTYTVYTTHVNIAIFLQYPLGVRYILCLFKMNRWKFVMRYKVKRLVF